MFFPHPQDPQNFLDEMLSEFRLLAFKTQSKLIILIDDLKNIPYKFLMYRTNVELLLLVPETDYDLLFQNVDCYIASDNPAEFPLLKYAWKHQIEVRSFSRERIGVFKNFPLDPNVEEWKSHVKQFVNEQFVNQFPFEEYEWIMFEHGLGESIVLFFFLKEFARQHRKKLLAICVKQSHYDLILQSPYVERALLLDWELYSYVMTYLPVKNFFNLHLLPESLKIYDEDICHPTSVTLIQTTRKFLNLAAHTPLNRYSVKIPPESFENARNRFESMKLKEGRTIFFMIAGKTSGSYEKNLEFFIELAKKFRDAGFTLVTNSADEELPGVPNIFLPFWESVAFMGFCGNVVGKTTGWIEAGCAVNEISRINWHAIFPRVHDPYFESEGVNFGRRLQLQGDNIVEYTMQSYLEFLNRILPSNIRVTLHKFSSSEKANQKLLEDIFDDIAR